MKVLGLNCNIDEPDIFMRKRSTYVMSDPVANNLATKYKKNIITFERFEPHYKPYMGHNMDNKKFILWRTGGFGDILFLTPIVRWLRHKYPSSTISVACSNKFKDIWEHNPHINHIGSSFVLPLDMEIVRRNDYVGIFEGSIESSKDKRQYCAIDVFAYSLGIFDMPLEFKVPQYFVTSSDLNSVKNKIKYKFGLDPRTDPYICFQWKSSSMLRDYPYQKLVNIMYELWKETGYKIVILGDKETKPIIDFELTFYKRMSDTTSKDDFSPINLAGEFSFRNSASLLSTANCLIGIDSALTHLAGALGVPSVSLYGPFAAEWRTIYYKNNISLQNQHKCVSAPCAFHVTGGRKNEPPKELCTMGGRFPKYGDEKYCHIMSSIQKDEIKEAFYILDNLQKKNELPTSRSFPCPQCQ